MNNELIQTLEAISDRLAGGGDLDATLAGFEPVFTGIMGARRWSVMLNSDGDTLRIHASRGISDGVLRNTVIRLGEGIAGRVAAGGQGGLFHDVQREFDIRSGGHYQARSAICVAIRLRGQVLGVINLNDKRGSGGETVEFTEADLSLALIIANQAAIAIEAARAVERERELNRLKASKGELEARVSQLEIRANAFELIDRVTDAMVTVGDEAQVLDGALNGISALLKATRASVMLIDEAGEHLHIHAAVGIADRIVRSARVPLGQGIAGRVALSGEPILLTNAERSRRETLPELDDRRDYRNPGAICVPIVIDGSVLGVMNVNDRKDGRDFSDGDLFVARVIARQAAIAISQARLSEERVQAARQMRDLRIAREIQQSFLPQTPRISGASVAGCSEPCDETGGDYIDYIAESGQDESGDVALLACGDVSGHGIGAALIMATGRAFLHALLSRKESVCELLAQLNNLVEADTAPDRFMTLFLGRFDLERSRFEYASAGHEIAWIYRPGNDRFLEMRATGIALGIFRDVGYECEHIEVHKGDILLIPTDGISEARSPSGEFFGYDRIKDTLREFRHLDAAEIVGKYRERVAEFAHPRPLDDDVSLVVMKLQA